MCKRFNCGLTPLFPYGSEEKFHENHEFAAVLLMPPQKYILAIRTKYQQFAVVPLVPPDTYILAIRTKEFPAVLLVAPQISLRYQNQKACGRSFDTSLDIPFIRFFPRHVFSTNEKLERYIKFSLIKFSPFQSRNENIIHDCVNLRSKTEQNI